MRISKSARHNISVEDQNANKIVFERYINMRPAKSYVDHQVNRKRVLDRSTASSSDEINDSNDNIFSGQQQNNNASYPVDIEQLDIERPRQLIRVRSFMYRNFQTLSNLSLRKWLFNTLALEVLVIVCLQILNLIIKMQSVQTNFSKQEQHWINITLDELIFVFIGFTVFRVMTLNLSTSDNRFYTNLMGLIIFQLTLNVVFLVIMISSLSKIQNIKYEIGYETDDGKPESQLIHLLFIFILFFGTFVSVFVFILITFIMVYMFTVRILHNRQDLGDVTLMNRRNQAMLRTIRKFPFGSILFIEATECAICLEHFKSTSEIVQLRCSKFHIFHFHCVKNLLESDYIPEFEKKCPLCRKKVEFQYPPILE